MGLAATDDCCLHRTISCAACGVRACGLADCDLVGFDVSYLRGQPVAVCQACGTRVELEAGVRPVEVAPEA